MTGGSDEDALCWFSHFYESAVKIVVDVKDVSFGVCCFFVG